MGKLTDPGPVLENRSWNRDPKQKAFSLGPLMKPGKCRCVLQPQAPTERHPNAFAAQAAQREDNECSERKVRQGRSFHPGFQRKLLR